MKNLYFILLFTTVTMYSNAQYKPLDLPTFKSWLVAADNTKDALLVKAGFKKGISTYDAEAGQAYNYNAGWVAYTDGYARFAQTVAWYPKYKMMSFLTLDKKNFDQLSENIKKIAKHTATEADKTESYEDANFIYTMQVVDFNEPLQKKHPSYVVGMARLK